MSEYAGNKEILKQNPLPFHVSELIDMKLKKGKENLGTDPEWLIDILLI